MIERSNAGDNGRSGNIKMPISSPESSVSVSGMNNGYSTNDTPPLPPHGSSANRTGLSNGDATHGKLIDREVGYRICYNINLTGLF